jgi:hypothetical protein
MQQEGTTKPANLQVRMHRLAATKGALDAVESIARALLRLCDVARRSVLRCLAVIAYEVLA